MELAIARAFRINRQIQLLIWLLILLTGSAYASGPDSETYFALQIENDTILDRDRDRYYTHGMELSRLKRETPPNWLTKLAAWVPLYRQVGEQSLVQYKLGQNIFTPNDIGVTALLVDDRPYAGYLYLGATLMSQTSNSKGTSFGNILNITVGVVGPAALAEKSQTIVHNLTGMRKPQGWDNQLSNELALGLGYSKFWRKVQPLSDELEYGVNRYLSANLGNVYTYGSGGLMFRLGSNLKRDLGPPNIAPSFSGTNYFKESNRSSWYLYLGTEARLVLQNIFLDGNTFASSHSVQKEKLVGELQYGFVYMLGKMRISAGKTHRTDEFSTQEERTMFGAINISVIY